MAFSPPASNGGSTITRYTVTATDSTTPANGGQTASGRRSPITVTGLDQRGHLHLHGDGHQRRGHRPPSSASNAVVPATVPDAPTIGTATAGNGSAVVAFTPPSTTAARPSPPTR